MPYNGSLERLRGLVKVLVCMLFLWGFTYFFLSWQVFVSSGFMNFFHFFFMTELFYQPLNFSNGPSIPVKLLLANLLVHVII